MTALPPELQYGHVVGRVILAVADTGDADAYPDAVPAQGTVTFTPKNPEIRVGEPDPVVVLKQKIVCTIDSAGYLTDPDGKRGVWLVTGVYTVSYTFNAAALPAHDIVVSAEHTLASPLDLTLALPPGGPVLTPSQYAELTARIDSLAFEASGVSSVNGATGTVVLDAADVGALPSTYTPPAQSWADVTEKPEAFTPTAHAASHATGGADPIEPADIGAATAAQGAKADSAVQPDDVDDVIREGDARLTDARTPTSHSHVYADITDPPTIPGPQTLSLTGSDLTLSGGGGTVTLPSGGGSGGTFPPIITPSVGTWIGGYQCNGSNANRVPTDSGRTNGSGAGANPTPFYLAQGATFDQMALQVATAEAGKSAKITIYDATLTLVHTTQAISLAGAGNAITTLAAPLTLPAGAYWLVVHSDATTAQIVCQNYLPPNGAQDTFNRLQSVGADAPLLNAGTFATPAATATWATGNTKWGSNNSPLIGMRRSA